MKSASDQLPYSAVLLAAGASSRMGRPKQTLRLSSGTTLVRHAAEQALASGADPVVVVVGSDAAETERELAGLPVIAVPNHNWVEGMGHSLSIGADDLQRLAPDAPGCLVLVCDQPLVTAMHLRALMETHRETGARVVASAYAGVLGTPALFDRALLDDLRDMNGDAGARRLIRRWGSGVVGVPLPGGEFDLDTPDDVARYEGSTR